MRTKTFITLILVLGMAGSSLAVSYNGTITTADYLTGFGGWKDLAGLSFSWTVDNETNSTYWTYQYSWTNTPKLKGLSHIDIAVSETFETSDLIRVC